VSKITLAWAAAVKVIFDYRQHSDNFPGSNLPDDAVEFARAIAAYQKATGRRFPAWSEVLEIAKSLGYRRVAPPTQEIQP